MANLQTIILNSGKTELLLSDTITFPKYFKLSSQEIPLLETTDANNYEYWYQKDIDVYQIIDQDTVEFTCILEMDQNINITKSICLYFDTDLEKDIPFLLGVLINEIQPGSRLVLSIQFKLTNASTLLNFSFITTDKMEEGILSLNNLITLGNQITKNTTLLNKIYLPDVLDTPTITSETFSLT
jgi:hypothetical protein